MSRRPILLATDMTAHSDRPLDRALMLATAWDVPLVLVHALDPKKAKKASLVPDDVQRQIEEELPPTDIAVTVIVEIGDVATFVLQAAEQEDCRLIVTGVAHYDVLSDIFLGSPTDQIIRKSSVPVLVVKRKPIAPYGEILIATDFSDCSLKALNKTAEMFPDVPLHLVHAFHVPYGGWLKSKQSERDVGAQEKKLMERFLAQTAISNETFDRLNAWTEEGDLSAVLLEKLQEIKASLVVLGAHGKTGFLQASVGNNTRILLGWLKQDVLVIR